MTAYTLQLNLTQESMQERRYVRMRIILASCAFVLSVNTRRCGCQSVTKPSMTAAPRAPPPARGMGIRI